MSQRRKRYDRMGDISSRWAIYGRQTDNDTKERPPLARGPSVINRNAFYLLLSDGELLTDDAYDLLKGLGIVLPHHPRTVVRHAVADGLLQGEYRTREHLDGAVVRSLVEHGPHDVGEVDLHGYGDLDLYGLILSHCPRRT